MVAIATAKASAPGRAVAVVACVGVTKLFPVAGTESVWQIVLGTPRGRSISALRDVSIIVPQGTFVGVLGRNGAGKSTLLRILAGVYAPTAGRVERHGSTSGLFEFGGLGGRFLTGREYAQRALLFQGVPRSRIGEVLEEVCEFSELEGAFDEPIFTYSTGMAARLYFSVATALRHDVYLIDELLAVGDEHFRSKCWQRIRERLAAGASGVLVTHDWGAALRLCEVCYILGHGRIIASGPTDRMVCAYLGLEKPASPHARFSASTPDRYRAASRADAIFEFPIEVDGSQSVTLGYSVEAFRRGMGWEVLLLADGLPLPVATGRYRVRLTIPRLPLPPGRYYLNLFLTSTRTPGAATPYVVYDVRSWTFGNAIELDVEGTSAEGVTVIPIRWVRRGATGS
jgi:lipopolysaccharide transport system ATP-binding protein